MFLESLLSTPGHKESTFQMLTLIVSQLNLLLCLVNDVLDIKLIKSGKFETKISIFEPIKTLRFIEDMFKPQAIIQNVTVSCHAISLDSLKTAYILNHQQELLEFEDLPKKIRGDNLRLQQILINLVKNALKFTVSGSVRVLMAFDTSEQMLNVHIVDTGKGIREEDMCKLFLLFGKLQSTASMNSEGIGMGLMICKNLVNINGG